eukprot:SAG25_NODE_12257_length_284_cov_0.389189_1_plen_23_part_01
MRRVDPIAAAADEMPHMIQMIFG